MTDDALATLRVQRSAFGLPSVGSAVVASVGPEEFTGTLSAVTWEGLHPVAITITDADFYPGRELLIPWHAVLVLSYRSGAPQVRHPGAY